MPNYYDQRFAQQQWLIASNTTANSNFYYPAQYTATAGGLIGPGAALASYGPAPTQVGPAATPKPETPLAWLDRRVKEMRVAL